jgi:hypothetical protein
MVAVDGDQAVEGMDQAADQLGVDLASFGVTVNPDHLAADGGDGRE